MSPAEVDRAWEEAVRSALLGTERQPSADVAEAAPDAPALERALAQLATRGAEARLLGTAGLLSIYRRAGRLPHRDERPLPEPAPEESSPRAPAGAARHLARMLEGEGAVALPEWLERAAARGLVVPAELLPALLEAGRAREELRDAIVPVLGARGRWLAARRPAWGWAVAAAGEAVDDGEAWEIGNAEVRVAVLRRLRRTDPARGLALLQSTWEADAPKDRAVFLAELAVGLSAADEPFLEATLDDRRKEVRTAAAEVLMRLPTSALVARMMERVRPLVRLTAPGGGLLARLTGGAKPAVEVELPTECTKEMQRDGISPKPPAGKGERAWWLEQMVAAVPPSVWTGESGAAPETWIAAVRLDWRELFSHAWSTAAVRHRDAEWAEALLRSGLQTVWPHAVALAGVLPPERYRAVGMELLAGKTRLSFDSPAVQYLSAASHPLGPELTRAVLALVRPGDAVADYGVREILRLLAPRLDPAAALDVVSAWDPAPRGAWVDLLHARHALHEAFAS